MLIAFEGYLEQGMRGVRMKIGREDPRVGLKRVREVRKALGIRLLLLLIQSETMFFHGPVHILSRIVGKKPRTSWQAIAGEIHAAVCDFAGRQLLFAGGPGQDFFNGMHGFILWIRKVQSVSRLATTLLV